MSEFSLDDILDKYGHKDGTSPGTDADDILSDILGDDTAPKRRGGPGERSEDPYIKVFGGSGGSAPPDSGQKRGDDEKRRLELEEKKREADKRRAEFEEKQRAAEEKRQKELAEKQRIAEERKRSELEVKRVLEEKRREELEAKRLAEEEKKRQAEAERQKKAEREKKQKERNDLIQGVIEEKERRKKRSAEENRQKDTVEIITPAEAERQRKAAEEAAAKEALEAERRRVEELEKERRRVADEEAERLLATKSIVLQDVPIELPKDRTDEAPKNAPVELSTEEIQLEKVLRAQKIEVDSQKLLIKDTELEDPNDFLNSINPYDLGKKSEYTQQIETISASGLSGDTKGVDINELRELSSAGSDDTRSVESILDGATRIMPDIGVGAGNTAIDPDSTFELGDDIKEFVPKTRDTKEVPRKRTEEEERLLRSVNDTIEQKRLADIRDTNPASVYDTGPFDKIVIPTRTVKYDSIGGKILRTGEIPKSDPEIAEQKLKELASKRKRRLSNFVLEDIADEDIDYYDDSDSEEAPVNDDVGIWTDLVETQKSLRLRFVLLFIVTVGLLAVNIIQKIFIIQKIGMFGNELGILDTNGIIFANLICGVVGMGLCSSVITSGLGKIFRGKADCDSVCAVTCTLSLAAAVLQLMNTNDLQQGRAFIYIPTALVGLLFNSVGKLSMISRARKNYRFISSDACRYYAEVIDGQSEASALTKGVVNELPYLVTMRKTELFTDFLKKSYCEDMADRVSRKLVPISLAIGLIMGLLVYFIPNSTEVNGVKVFDSNIYWASSVFIAFVNAMAPFSMMFMVNNPFKRASRKLLRHGTALLGYTSAEEFGETNSVIVDASTLFPKSAVECTNIKPCKLQNSMNNISLDMAIILAASLAVSCDSVLSSLLFDMIGGNKDMLVKIDGCVYEDNMGVMGWYENKRLIMGSREHMKHHSIKIPEMNAIAKYSRNGSDCVYLAVGGELAVIFFIRLTANPNVRTEIKELTDRGVSVVLKTTDSLITTGKISDLFDIDPEKIRIIGASLHGLYGECSSYTASGCGALAGTGSFVSLAKGINASKKLLKDIGLSRTVMLFGTILGTMFMIFLSFSSYSFIFSPEMIIGWNTLWLLIMLFFQCFRRY
jgi:Cu+-exporting ATPase